MQLPENAAGRDFLIGDVHGAFDEVWKAMQAAGFNRACDRLFSVGDLIDRGADSARAGRLLDQPYVFAIQGNHEADLTEIYLEQEDPCAVLEAASRINFNGMGWLQATSEKERADLIKRFAALPIAREIPTERGTVGIVHGEVPRGMDWQTFTSSITSGNNDVIESCLQGRTRLKTKDTSAVPGAGRVFAGHTPAFDGAARLGNAIA